MIPLTIPPEILRPGTVLLVHRRSWLGALIRWVTWSDWNHSALIEGALHGDQVLLIEAHDLEGVKHCTIEGYTEDPAVRGLAVYEWPGLTIAQIQAICECAEAHNGMPYDTLQLVGIYLRARLPWVGKTRNRLDRADRMICSELVGRAYLAAGINLCPPGVGIGCLSPGHLAQTMRMIWEGWR